MFAPQGEQFAWATTTDAKGVTVRIENPGLQVPVSFLLDDPAPLRNPMFFQRIMRPYVEVVPNSFTSAFADMVERTGMRGKFSVLPYPLGLGRIDRNLEGVTNAELEGFLEIVRDRIAPQFDISPEMLTHWNALDLSTGCLLPYWEHDWSRMQNRATLTPYVSLALEILNNVNLSATGVTSPWDFGHYVEDEYVASILAAQRSVNGLGLSWYFLDWDGESRVVPPRVMHLNPEEGSAVVSIIGGDGFDFAWQTQDGEPAQIDRLVTADGTEGRLVDLACAGSPAVFVSHWQSMFSNGSATGLAALEEVANRLIGKLGDSMRWTSAAELATVAAAAAANTFTTSLSESGGWCIALTTPFACPLFTISVSSPEIDGTRVRSVSVRGRELRRQNGGNPLSPGNWDVRDGRLYMSWNLDAGDTEVSVAAA